MKKMAIISSYNELCGNATYTEVLRKEFSKSERQKLLQFILSKFNVITEEKSDFETVLNEDDLDDLEDGLQMQCAKKANLDYIITENTKDFSTSFVQVLSTSDFLALIGE